MDITQSSNRVINSFPPLNNITPFTRVDGWSFLEVLEGLRHYIVSVLTPGIDSNFEEFYNGYIKNFNALLDDIENSKNSWKDYFDEFMSDVNEQLKILNDKAVADLVEDLNSQIRIALDDSFVNRGKTVEFWVSPTIGNDSNSGDKTSPLKTLAKAIELTKNKVLDHGESVNIKLFPEVYTERVVIPHTSTRFTLNIYGHPVGGHPNVPQSIWWKGGSVSEQAFTSTSPNANVTLYDIKFVDYNGATSSGGYSNTEGEVTFINVHASRCNFGARSQHGSLTVKGGIFEECGYTVGGGTGVAALNSYMVNKHEIGSQNAGNYNGSPIFRRCRTAVSIHEATSGHVDWCVFEDNKTGLFVGRNATLNPSGSKFLRNDVGISASNGANFFTSNNVFGTGNDANGMAVNATGMSFIGSNQMWTSIVTSDSLTDYLVRDINSPNLITNTTETEYSAYFGGGDLTPEWWNDVSVGLRPNKAYITRINGEVLVSSGSLRFTTLLGSASESGVFVNADSFKTGAFEVYSEIIFIDRGEQLIRTKLLMDGNQVKISTKRTSVDMSAGKIARIQMRMYGGQIAGSSMRIDSVQNWFRG